MPHEISVKPSFQTGFWVAGVEGVTASAGPVTVRVADGQLPRAEITGRLLDAQGKPVGGATVFVWKGPVARSCSSGHVDGRFRLGPVAPGTYRILATHEQHPWLDLGEHEVARAETLDLGEIRFPVAGRLIVTVVRADGSGKPLACSLQGTELMGTAWESRGNGVYRSVPLAPGNHVVRAGGAGAADVRRVVTVEAGETTSVEILVPPGARRWLRFPEPERGPPARSCRVVVRDEAGEVVFDATVRRHEDQPLGISASFARGTFQVAVEADNGLSAQGTFTVTRLEPRREPIDVALR